MKTRFLILVSLLLAGICVTATDPPQKTETGGKGQLIVYCTEELHSLASGWANEYNKTDQGIAVQVEVTDDVISALYPGDHIGITSGPITSIPDVKPEWFMTIGRDIVVPVVNSSNPWMKEIRGTGIANASLAGLLGDPEKYTWKSLVPGSGESQVHLYISNERSVGDVLLEYTGLNGFPAGSERLVTAGSKEVVRHIQEDPLAIGFCRLSEILGQGENGLVENLSFLPLDRNSNGKLDYMEDIYSDADAFTRGVWIGKYPKALYEEIYSVSAGQPENTTAVAFLSWIVTEGQKYLPSAGYSELVLNEQQSNLDRIANVPFYTAPVERVYSIPKVILLIAAGVLMLGLIAGTLIRNRRLRPVEASPVAKPASGVFDENSVAAPRGLFYDRTHTWAFMEKDGSVRIGIDDFLQHVTGTLTRIEMKKPGDQIRKGEVLVSLIQHGKTLRIYAPVSGTILESNRSLQSDSSLLNSSPFADGWVYTVEPSNWSAEQKILQKADKYVQWIYGEFSRLKDFLAISLNSDKLKYSRVVLQDGGALRDNILEEFGPEVWEDFQTDFLDAER